MAAVPFAFVEADACRAALDRADHLRNDPAALAQLWPQARSRAHCAWDGITFATIETPWPCAPTWGDPRCILVPVNI